MFQIDSTPETKAGYHIDIVRHNRNQRQAYEPHFGDLSTPRTALPRPRYTCT